MASYVEEIPYFLLCQIPKLHHIFLEAELFSKPKHRAHKNSRRVRDPQTLHANPSHSLAAVYDSHPFLG